MNQIDLNNVPVMAEPGLMRSPMSQKCRNKRTDKYCWLCHQMVEDECNRKVCKECPRVYHLQCIPYAHRNIPGNVCLECKSVSVDGTDPITIYDKSLSKLLMLILNPIINKYKNFKRWPGETHKKNSEVCHEMELVLLRDRVKNGDYSSTAKFFADVKWMYHNASIVFGTKDPLTVKAKSLVSEMKTRLMDLEACVDCFYSLNTDESTFIELCHNVHKLVWVKLKGHPYWPAKVLKVINKKAHVVYFGSHERSKVSVADFYPLSKENPGGKVPKKESYISAIEELELHIQNHVDRFDKYQYAEPKSKRSLPTGRKQKRKRAKTGEPQNNSTNAEESSQNHSTEATMISDSEVTSSMDNNDCDLSESSQEYAQLPDHMMHAPTVEMPRRLMTDQVAQSSEIQVIHSSDIQVVHSSEIQGAYSSEIQDGYSSEVQVTHPNEIPGVELVFSVGEVSQVETLNYDDLSGRIIEKDLNKNERPPEIIINNIIENILTEVTSTGSHNLESDLQILDNTDRSEPQVPFSAFSPGLFMLEDVRLQSSQQVSQIAYKTIMDRLRPMIRDICNDIANVSNSGNTEINRVRNYLFRAEQEYESLRIRYQAVVEEKKQMKNSADELVTMLHREINTFQKKKAESDDKIRLLESQVRELKKNIALSSKPVQEAETDGLNIIRNAAVGCQTSLNGSDECATNMDEQDNSKKSAKHSSLFEANVLPIDETSPTSTCFPPDSDDHEHPLKESSNTTTELVPVLPTDSSLTSSDKEMPDSELQSSAISSEAEPDLCTENVSEQREANNH